jgi:hypothetical protein
MLLENTYEQFIRGTQLFLESSAKTLSDRKIQKLLLKVVVVIVGLWILAHLVTFFVLLPLKITFTVFQLLLLPFGVGFPDSLLSLLSLLPESWHGVPIDHETSLSIALRSYVNRLILSLPYVLLLVMRYLWWEPLDSLFRHGLALWDPKLADELYTLPPLSLLECAKNCVIRMTKRLAMSLVLVLLSVIPVVGHFVFPSAQFYLTYKSLGFPLAIALFAANLLPFVNPYSRGLYEHLYSCQSLARELLEPYFTRTRPPPSERSALVKKYAPLFYGFFTPFALCQPITLLGPIAFVVAQAAIAVVLVKEMDKNKDLPEQHDSKSP